MKKDIDVGKYKTGYLKGQDSSFPMDNWWYSITAKNKKFWGWKNQYLKVKIRVRTKYIYHYGMGTITWRENLLLKQQNWWCTGKTLFY
jgi:hypothetical protein